MAVTARSARPKRLTIAALAGLALSVLSPALAHADACRTLRAQMASGSSTTTRNPEIAQLSKQLAAIGGLERQRGCRAGKSGGFFSACGDLASRRVEVQRKMAAASRSGSLFGSSRASAARARYAALGCTEPARQRRADDSRPQGAYLPGGNAMLFCVRLSDGYFFPTPNSQFVGKEDDYKNTLDRCQYICDDRGMDLYALNDISLETEEMISIETRKAYKDLPTAFAYREASTFKACEASRYHERVNEARARTVTPSDMSNAIIPLPAPRPPANVDSLTTAFAAEETPLDPSKKVRVIVPFLPEE